MMIYGMGENRLASRFNMAKPRAIKIIEHYLTTFPGMRPYMNSLARQCEKAGLVRLWSGRIWRENDPKKSYKATNAVVQGGGADILAEAACRVHDFFTQEKCGGLVSLVHDELVSEIQIEGSQEIVKQLVRIQEVPDLFNIPFLVEAKCGKTYGTLSKEGYESKKI